MPDLTLNPAELVKLDRECMWHHIMPHKIFETQEPMIMVEGKGCMVKDVHGREEYPIPKLTKTAWRK
ncbi:MAG: hypothetical protein ACOY4I_03800 [Bacillota bacterium]